MIDSGPTSVDLLAAIAAVQRQFIVAAEPQLAFDGALKLLVELSESEFGIIGEVLQSSNGDRYLESRAFTNVDWEGNGRSDQGASRRLEIERLQDLMGEVIRAGRAIVSNEPAADRRFADAPTGRPPLDAFLGLPIFGSEGDLVGVAGLANRPNGYDDDQIAQLQPLCDTLAAMFVAMKRDRLRREAEETLRVSEARNRTIVDHATIGLFLQDLDGSVVDVNREACESLGYERDELIGMAPPDFDPTITVARRQEIIDRLDSGETVAFDSRHRRKDGSEFPVEVRIRPFWVDGQRQVLALARDITERKQAEEALRASESRYRTFVDHVTDGLFLIDENGQVVDVNRMACERLGYERDELIGMYPTAFDPDVTPEVVDQRMSRLSAGETIAFDSRHRRKDGSVFPVEVRIRPLRVDDKLFALALACDITERKRAEEALFEAQQRLTIILKGADVGLWDWDLLTNAVDFSNEWKSQLGYGENEIVGRFEEWKSRVHPDDLDLALVKVKIAIETCSSDYNAEFRMRHKDGSWRWILALGFVIADADGKAVRMRGVHIDITDRKQSELALRESEARLRTLLENLENVAVQAFEPDGTITFWNRASEIFYGYSAADALGRDLVELLHSEPTRDAERTVMAEALRTGKPLAAREVEVVRRDGSKITVFARRTVHTRPGRPPEFFCFDVDISDRKRAEEELAVRQAELLHASRLTTVGQMVAELSHEVAQPLSAIGNFAAASDRILADATAENRDTLHEYIRAIVKQNQRCGAILQRLRDFSRRTSASQSDCDIGELLRESVELISSELQRNNVKVRFDLAHELPPVRGDRVQLQQVVVNLLTNARDAVREQVEHRRMVTIRTSAEPDGVVFDVDDLGTGLSDKVVAHLFDPFFTTKAKGMGIGLSICQSIIKDHGGRIEAFSNAAGGATFRVRIPFSRKTDNERISSDLRRG